MVYDEKLAERVRKSVAAREGISEKRMFGGIAFLLDGKMFCGVASEDLMVRVGPDNFPAALAQKHARPMDFTGRPMKGYVYVGPPGVATTKDVKRWTELALSFVSTVAAAPKKKAKKAPRAQREVGAKKRRTG